MYYQTEFEKFVIAMEIGFKPDPSIRGSNSRVKAQKNTQSGTTSNSTGSHPVLPKVTVDSTDKNKDSTMNGQYLTRVVVG